LQVSKLPVIFAALSTSHCMQATAKKNRFKRIFVWTAWVLLVQFILINVSSALHAYRLTHFYDDPALRTTQPESGNIFSKTWKLFAGSRLPKSVLRDSFPEPVSTVVLKTSKGIAIESWYSKRDSSRGTVLLFHGVTVNRSYLVKEAYAFYLMGYNVMLTDLRAHGNSGGTVSTYGIRETEEVKMVYDYVAGKGEKNIFLYGLSMGAVVVAKAIYDYRLQPAGLILEAPFASLQDHFEARARNLGFPEQPFGLLVSFWAGVEQGFNGWGHKTTRYAKQINCPVLLQCGGRDNYVSRKEVNSIYSNITDVRKKLNFYEEAGHESLLEADPVRWQKEVTAFLEANKVK
jgi:uncharacterized protein